MSDASLPLVVYLAGDREIHRPEVSVGVTGPLDVQVPAALQLPLAPLPAPGAVAPEPGQVQLLRLDRLHQHLVAAAGWPTVELLFVLTQQADVAHAPRDTWHLEPLLRRWCEQRGHSYASARIHGPPNRLDGGALELIEELDAHLGAVDEVLLVSGGGPAAMQIGAHVASFRGVRHRDALTVVQLEEVVEVPPASHDGATRARSRRLPVDTRVRVVERFPGVVGRRSVQAQAIVMIDELDLPGAAQLIRASGRTGLLAPPALRAADDLLARLARTAVPDGPVAAVAAALDLAELEWSRPGGSRAEALWYATLCAVDLLPVAWATTQPRPPATVVGEQARRRFNQSLGRGAVSAQLRLTAPLLERAAPLLAAAPARVRAGSRTLRFDQLTDDAHRGDAPLAALVWLALLGSLRAHRNELAHELIGVSPATAASLLDAAGAVFAELLELLTARTPDLAAAAATLTTSTSGTDDQPLSLRVAADTPASRLRQVCAAVVPGLPAGNGALRLAADLRSQLV